MVLQVEKIQAREEKMEQQLENIATDSSSGSSTHRQIQPLIYTSGGKCSISKVI